MEQDAALPALLIAEKMCGYVSKLSTQALTNLRRHRVDHGCLIACFHCLSMNNERTIAYGFRALTTMKERSFLRCSGVVSGSDATSKHLRKASVTPCPKKTETPTDTEQHTAQQQRTVSRGLTS